jgi:hypothetical protein
VKLKALEGQIVRLSFADGEEIVARIAAVDVDDHEDIIYSVLRVLRPGPDSEYDSTSLYRSRIDTTVDVSSNRGRLVSHRRERNRASREIPRWLCFRACDPRNPFDQPRRLSVSVSVTSPTSTSPVASAPSAVPRTKDSAKVCSMM